MTGGRAPKGYYTRVDVDVRLSASGFYTWTWDTPLCLSAALHKAPRWAQEELKKIKAKGRSKIQACLVRVQYVKGHYR